MFALRHSSRLTRLSTSQTRAFCPPSSKHVGFVGLGNMGASMAKNLMKAGYTLSVFDKNPAILKEFSENGAKIASTPAEVAKNVNALVTMLPSSPHVKEVYEDANGVFSAIAPGSLLIDASTINPDVSRDLAKKAMAKAKCEMVDAPVSGGVVAAANGTLTFMVGGTEKGFVGARELLQHMGKNVVHCGGAGNGQAVKICNNLLLAISMIGTSEAMNLGISLGLSPQVLAGVLNTSTGRCWSSDSYNPVPGVIAGVPSSREYKGGFASKLMLKDLGLAMEAAESCGQEVPLGKHSQEIYGRLSKEGFGDLDFSSVYLWLQKLKEKK